GLADDDYLEFYGQQLSNRFTGTNVYWLAYGGAQGQRVTARDVTPSGPPAAVSFPDTARIEENHYYITDYHAPPQGDPWYWGVLYNLEIPRPFFYVTLTTQFTLPELDAAPGISATLQLALHGASCFDCPDTLSQVHHPRVTLNGVLVFDQVLLGDIYHSAVVSFPQNLLQPGANTLAVTNLPLDPGVTADASFFDWFEIGYRRALAADAGRLAFQPDLPEPAPLEVTGFTAPDIALYDVTDPLAPVRLTGGAVAGGGPYSLHFEDSLAGRGYFAFAGGAALTPTAIEPDTSASDLRDTANSADEIFIAYDDFLPALTPLAGLRQSDGLRTMVVRVSDIYDEFSDGVFEPAAIQRFLEYAYANWEPPAPAYVLLLGDGNFNYRDYQGNNLGDDNQSAASEINFVPPYMVNANDPLLGEVAADNRYVMLTPLGLPDKDRLPDMAIGRLPARDLTEAQAIVAKLVAYQSAPPAGDWRQRVAFYADNYRKADGTADGAGDFPGLAEAQIAAYLPPDYLSDRVYYDPSQPSHPPYYNTVAEVQTQIRAGLNAGSLIANYLGHGARTQWANENLLDAAGVAALANGDRLPVVIEQTCYTGQFAWPGADTLAETWLRGAPAGGAVAGWAASGASVATGHDALAGGFLDAVFAGGVTRLGPAADAGKLALYATGASLDLMDSFVLFGDPATVLASAAPVPTFADVPLDYWAYAYIESLYAAGITGGCAPGAGDPPGLPYYCPESSVNRAQMAVFLLRGTHGAAGYSPPAATGAMFADVAANYWAAAWIEQLAREGITGGCAPGTGDPPGLPYYCPEGNVTRAQMSVFLLRAEHSSSYTPPPATGAMFSDVPAGHWAAAWIEQLAREGITGGCGPGLYCPETPVTRAQMAVFLVRTFQLPLP
ncbi:MAG: S-layer homology domain-containing protein, partial [Chloroflexi bacterium]|nr:S-layer homology domain-containing protein [Chloroflexota bacterium]